MTESPRFTDFVGRALKKDRLTLSERGGEVFGILCIVLFFWFFRENDIQNTGFFTSKFGPMESFLFYGSILFGVVTGSARALIGRKNVVRPLQVVGALLSTFASYRFLQVFPFDFSHLPDLLPDALKFLLGWLTNDIAMLLLIIGVVCAIMQAIYTAWLFMTVLRKQQANRE